MHDNNKIDLIFSWVYSLRESKSPTKGIAMGLLDLFFSSRKESANTGLIGKRYMKHEKRPVIVVCNEVLIRDNGDGTYRSEDGSVRYTYEQLFGDLLIAKMETAKKSRP
ncbi:MAG: hypothetical protein QG653_540 [Patescibacteria group bacterium]|nr:hypothetical protein [Patescibacteria group bacterium]